MTSVDPDIACEVEPAPRALVGRGAGLRARVHGRVGHPRWVLFAALAGMFANTFPITILTVSLSAIAVEFGTTESAVAWVISAPMLLSAVSLPLLGKLGDLHGHRRVFLIGSLLATATAIATAFAWDLASLIALRTVAAVVGGATQPTSMALIFNTYGKEQRVRAMGWWSMTGAAAPALGLIAGGPLVDWLGWRAVFVFQGVLSLVALALATAVLRETRRQRVRFDVAGAGALAVGVAGFMFALGNVREAGATSPAVALPCLAGVLGIVCFVFIERRTPSPLLPLEFFRQRMFSASIVSNAFMGAAYMGAFVMAPLVLLQVFGFSISAAAGIMLLRTITLTLSSPVGGHLGARIGERAAASIGAAIMTVALIVMAWGVAESRLALVGIGLVLQGMGHGLALPSLTAAVSTAVPESDLGIAAAANRLTGAAGAAFGITLLTLVYASMGAGADGGPAHALSLALATGAALSVASLFAALAMGARRSA